MPNPWPARWPSGSRAVSMEYPLKSGATFLAGAFVVADGSNDVDECGADPASILGIAAEPAAGVVRSGYVNVYLADPTTIFAIRGSTDPAKTHLLQEYGIVKSGTEWKIDITETTNKRLMVLDIDIPRKLFFVRVLSAVRQPAV